MGAQEDLDFWDAVFADSGMAVTYKAGGKVPSPGVQPACQRSDPLAQWIFAPNK